MLHTYFMDFTESTFAKETKQEIAIIQHRVVIKPKKNTKIKLTFSVD